MKSLACLSLIFGSTLFAASAQAKQLSDAPTHDGWLKYGQFGWVWNADYPWVFNQNMGWFYAAEVSSAPSAYWLYDQSSDLGPQWFYYSEQDGPWVYTDLFGPLNTSFWKWRHIKAGLQHEIIPVASLTTAPQTTSVKVEGVSLGWTSLTLDLAYTGGGERSDFFLFADHPTSWLDDYEMIGAIMSSQLKLVDGAAGSITDTGVYHNTVTFSLLPLVEAWGLRPGEGVELTIGNYQVTWIYSPFF